MQPLHEAGADIADVECVEAEVAGQFLTDEDAANAVALVVKPGRIDADAQLAVNDAKDAAGDADMARDFSFR